ncbi:MAG: ABC transporter permease [Rhizobium sp.]
MSSATLTTLETRPQRRLVPLRWYAPRNILRFLLPVAVLAAWQTGSASGLIQSQTLPSPGEVIEAFAELIETGDLQAALPASLARAGVGLFLGLLIGVGFGLFTGLSRLAEEIFDSSFQIVRLVPFIALVPLFIVWFGIGEEPKILLITLACIFPAYLNTYAGVRNVDSRLVEAARTFGLTPLQITLQVLLPAALPGVLVGVRFAMGTSLLALIVAEQTNSRAGIGYLIFIASGAMRIDLIVACVLVYAVLGIAVDLIMRAVEKAALPWR